MVKALRKCDKGHEHYKSSDCPTCPVCEREKKSTDAFFAQLSAPAGSALRHFGIENVTQLSAYSEKEILKLHGMGKASLPKLKELLAAEGLTFKQ